MTAEGCTVQLPPNHTGCLRGLSRKRVPQRVFALENLSRGLLLTPCSFLEAFPELTLSHVRGVSLALCRLG